MGLFVHEYFSSGADPGDLRQSSLACEGLAMLEAVLRDFAACPAAFPANDRDPPLEYRPATTLDCRLRSEPRAARLAEVADVHWAESTEHEQFLFRRLAARAEATFVIAPESHGILLARRGLVEEAGGRFLGHSAPAIRLCSDKLAFSEHLTRHNLPTIPSRLFDPQSQGSTFSFPIVVKPRDGAGSQDTFLIADENQFEALRPLLAATFGNTGGGRPAIIQPFVAGQNLSIAAIADGASGLVQVFPAGEQHLSHDGRFQYQGGKIPAEFPESLEPAALLKTLVTDACRSIAGLAGYLGFDLIRAPDPPRILIVETNPRLTTSYLGYRALADENLAARILQPSGTARPIAWKSETVKFQPDGRLSFCTH